MCIRDRGISYCGDLEQTLAARGLEAHPFLEIGDTEVIIEMLLNKAGISFLPQYLVQKYIDSGQLASIGTDLPPIENWSQLVYHKNKYVTPQMKAFIDLVKKHVEMCIRDSIKAGSKERLRAAACTLDHLRQG